MANFQQSGTSSYNQYSSYGTDRLQYGGSQQKGGSESNYGTQSQIIQNQQQMYEGTSGQSDCYAAPSRYGYGYAYGSQSYASYGQSTQHNCGGAAKDDSMCMTGNNLGSNTGSITSIYEGNSFGGKNTSNCSDKNSSKLGLGGNSPSSFGYSGNTSLTEKGPRTTRSLSGTTGAGSTSTNTNLGGNIGGSNTNSTSTMSGTYGGSNTIGIGRMIGGTNINNTIMSGHFGGTNTNSNSTTTDSSNSMGQMFGTAFGNMQSSGLNNNAGSSMLGQNFSNDPNVIGHLGQMFGTGGNIGNNLIENASGTDFGMGINPFNNGMMSSLQVQVQQSLMQQANGAADASHLPGSGMSDGEGGYYAAPMESPFQFGIGNTGGNFGKKWSGKDTKKQDFYGNRFAQMLTGAPGVLGKFQGKGKRLQDGVRINIKGEKVVDVEVPLALYSRWGQLRKYFSKQDTEVVAHLLTLHDEMCEECLKREQRKKSGLSWSRKDVSLRIADKEDKHDEDQAMTEEDFAMQQIMGFGSFNTTRGAMVEGNQVDAVSTASGSSKFSALEKSPSFIGPTGPAAKEKKKAVSKGEAEISSGNTLSEEEKQMMVKLGWSVFNKKTGETEDEDDDVDEKIDDGVKDGSADEGNRKDT